MLSNILMKLERNTERKYSMQAMSTTTTTATTATATTAATTETTTTTTTTKRKFRFTREFMLVLELKSFYSGASNILDIFKC